MSRFHSQFGSKLLISWFIGRDLYGVLLIHRKSEKGVRDGVRGQRVGLSDGTCGGGSESAWERAFTWTWRAIVARFLCQAKKIRDSLLLFLENVVDSLSQSYFAPNSSNQMTW